MNETRVRRGKTEGGEEIGEQRGTQQVSSRSNEEDRREK